MGRGSRSGKWYNGVVLLLSLQCGMEWRVVGGGYHACLKLDWSSQGGFGGFCEVVWAHCEDHTD
jgi:hypothetical protein